MSGNTSRKHGSNKDACKTYASSHREERNKKRNVARQARFERKQEDKKTRRIAAAAKDTRKRIPKKWMLKNHNGKHTLLGIGITYIEAKKVAEQLGLTKPFIERETTMMKDKDGKELCVDAWRYAHRFAEEAA